MGRRQGSLPVLSSVSEGILSKRLRKLQLGRYAISVSTTVADEAPAE
jgi:hypothetical protein